MKKKELIKELEKINDEAEIKVMINFRTVEIMAVSGDDEEGFYLETSET